MPLEVWTARMGVAKGDDVLDITRKSAGPEGLVFAPSWAILDPVMKARGRQRALFLGTPKASREELVERAREIEQQAWERYVPAYLEEMRASYRAERAAWRRLLDLPRICLLCYCPKRERCHRTILARDILPKLGAIYAGEIEPVKRRQAALFAAEGADAASATG